MRLHRSRGEVSEILSCEALRCHWAAHKLQWVHSRQSLEAHKQILSYSGAIFIQRQNARIGSENSLVWLDSTDLVVRSVRNSKLRWLILSSEELCCYSAAHKLHWQLFRQGPEPKQQVLCACRAICGQTSNAKLHDSVVRIH